MTGAVRDRARAKINLCLHVTGRRDDGYHLLDSLVCFAEASDALSAENATGIALTITGPFGATLRAEADNLVLRAARAVAARLERPCGATLHLDKRLPLASGIGGGSADAAATLRVLSVLWDLPAPIRAALPALALGLGADVPVCLAGMPARMRGIGEALDPVTLPAFGLVLVNPLHAVPTGAVFQFLLPQHWSGALVIPPLPDLATLVGWLRGTANDLEAPARTLCPPIGTVLDALGAMPSCLLARMSGSGATCFGVFANRAEAEHAAAALSASGWWCWGGEHAGRLSPNPL